MPSAVPSTRSCSAPIIVVAMLTCHACSPASSNRGPTRIEGSSQTLTVAGEYAPVAIERIERLSLAGRTLVLHGPSSERVVPLPADATEPKPGDQWVLVTEGKAADGKRTMTFTHAQSLADFTINLPYSDAELRYGSLAGKTAGEDVLVFAWGKDSRCYWGYVTITRSAEGSANP
jgi:hypothetical protein